MKISFEVSMTLKEDGQEISILGDGYHATIELSDKNDHEWLIGLEIEEIDVLAEALQMVSAMMKAARKEAGKIRIDSGDPEE